MNEEEKKAYEHEMRQLKELEESQERQRRKERIRDERLRVQGDPWAHRSVGMRCDSCMWFVPKASEVFDQPNKGRCRRHAPTMGGFPVVFTTDWCGDHKLA